MLAWVRGEAFLRALDQLCVDLLAVEDGLVLLALFILQLVLLVALLLYANLYLASGVQPQRHAKLGPVLLAREDLIDRPEGQWVGRGTPPPIHDSIQGGVGTAMCVATISATLYHRVGTGRQAVFLALSGVRWQRTNHFIKGRSRNIPDKVSHCLEPLPIVQLVDFVVILLVLILAIAIFASRGHASLLLLLLSLHCID